MLQRNVAFRPTGSSTRGFGIRGLCKPLPWLQQERTKQKDWQNNGYASLLRLHELLVIARSAYGLGIIENFSTT